MDNRYFLVQGQIKEDEGKRLKSYNDSEGHLTIGYGRNLSAVGIHDDEAELMFENDFSQALAVAFKNVANFVDLSYNRKGVLIGMAFNLGEKGFKGFKKMIAAVEKEDFETAADEILDSKAARQLPERYGRYAEEMRKG